MDTFAVHFPINEVRINKESAKYIDSLIASNRLIPGHKIMLFGYTDYLGSVGHNDSLSQSRAKNVQSHLLAVGFNKQDIALCTGKGEIVHSSLKIKGGYANDRKVLIIAERYKPASTPIKSKPIASIDTTKHAVKQSKLDISQVKVNETIALKNIYFEGNEPTITVGSLPELEELYLFLKSNKALTIQIEGHICCLPPEEGTDRPYQKSTLSTMRAKAVYDYLAANGIEKRRLKYIGLGNTQPKVSPEETEEDMEQNRRVEVRVLSR